MSAYTAQAVLFECQRICSKFNSRALGSEKLQITHVNFSKRNIVVNKRHSRIKLEAVIAAAPWPPTDPHGAHRRYYTSFWSGFETHRTIDRLKWCSLVCAPPSYAGGSTGATNSVRSAHTRVLHSKHRGSLDLIFIVNQLLFLSNNVLNSNVIPSYLFFCRRYDQKYIRQDAGRTQRCITADAPGIPITHFRIFHWKSASI